MDGRTLILVDGENIVIRYQALLKSGRTPLSGCLHKPDVFVWKKMLTQSPALNIIRVSYYTSMVGDDAAVVSMEQYISQAEYVFKSLPAASTYEGGELCPCVYKKPAMCVRQVTS